MITLRLPSLILNQLRSDGKLVITEQGRLDLGTSTKERHAKNGHPRGMLGKTHSENARAKMSVAGQARSSRETEEQKSVRSLKMLKTKAANGTMARQRPETTWKAGWRPIGGQRCYFRSRWEANYARYLQFLVDKKQIIKWEHEPETFWFEDIKRGCRSYLPDFRVTELSGLVIYHEVKGWMDDRSKTKINRMRIYHPNIKLIIIEKKTYMDIYRKLGNLLDGWEK